MEKVVLHKRVAWLSLAVGFTILIFKFYAYRLTHSEAIFSDAMESIVNVLAALFLVNIVSLSLEPPDANHPYGHGKFEYFSSAFEGGLVAFAGLAILYRAVDTLLKGSRIDQLSTGMWITAGCALVNLVLGFYIYRLGKKGSSAALVADGIHLMTDFVTSFAMIGGLAIVAFTGWVWMDAVIAMAFALFLSVAGYRLIRKAAAGLTDETDKKLVTRIGEIMRLHRQEGLIQLHHVRVIQAGHFHHIDAHVVVPFFWTIEQSHEVTDGFAEKVIQYYPHDGEVALHLDPCRRAYCENCDLKNCDERQKVFAHHLPIDLETLIDREEPVGHRTV